jgi:hypothetical protein
MNISIDFCLFKLKIKIINNTNIIIYLMEENKSSDVIENNFKEISFPNEASKNIKTISDDVSCLLVHSNDNSASLQENFKKFLKKRKEIRKFKIANEKEDSIENSNAFSFRVNPDRMKELRVKFIERAISYLGVPYDKKYLTEDHHLYNSPLFLDCCALVRHCVNDLSEEFGFRLGRWNQAYQFDILPDLIEFKDLQPGDLIFYEASYYKDKGWKDQPHNMVHVEIYMGDYKLENEDTINNISNAQKSERTIAAREKRGVVQFFDTFQFTSENYYDIKYSFKSIDPWLQGIHKSYCKEHEWKEDLPEVSKNIAKFSLFDLKEEQDYLAEEKI